MFTYRVVNIKPFRGVGLNKLAINEQLGGGLEDHRGIWLNSFLLVTSSLSSLGIKVKYQSECYLTNDPSKQDILHSFKCMLLNTLNFACISKHMALLRYMWSCMMQPTFGTRKQVWRPLNQTIRGACAEHMAFINSLLTYESWWVEALTAEEAE